MLTSTHIHIHHSTYASQARQALNNSCKLLAILLVLVFVLLLLAAAVLPLLVLRLLYFQLVYLGEGMEECVTQVECQHTGEVVGVEGTLPGESSSCLTETPPLSLFPRRVPFLPLSLALAPMGFGHAG